MPDCPNGPGSGYRFGSGFQFPRLSSSYFFVRKSKWSPFVIVASNTLSARGSSRWHPNSYPLVSIDAKCMYQFSWTRRPFDKGA
jgi:hypothetical protein